MKESEMTAQQQFAINQLRDAMKMAIDSNYMSEDQARTFFAEQMREIGCQGVPLTKPA